MSIYSDSINSFDKVSYSSSDSSTNSIQTDSYHKMGFTYFPPDAPSQPGPFPVQHGYADLDFDKHNYNGKPSPLNPTTHHKAGNFEKFAKHDNTKKAGNFVLGQLKGFLLSRICG